MNCERPKRVSGLSSYAASLLKHEKNVVERDARVVILYVAVACGRKKIERETGLRAVAIPQACHDIHSISFKSSALFAYSLIEACNYVHVDLKFICLWSSNSGNFISIVDRVLLASHEIQKSKIMHWK